jgi:hypothetical protein
VLTEMAHAHRSLRRRWFASPQQVCGSLAEDGDHSPE